MGLRPASLGGDGAGGAQFLALRRSGVLHLRGRTGAIERNRPPTNPRVIPGRAVLALLGFGSNLRFRGLVLRSAHGTYFQQRTNAPAASIHILNCACGMGATLEVGRFQFQRFELCVAPLALSLLETRRAALALVPGTGMAGMPTVAPRQDSPATAEKRVVPVLRV